MSKDGRVNCKVNAAQVKALMAAYPHCDTVNQAMTEHLKNTLSYELTSALDANGEQHARPIIAKGERK